MRVAPMYRNQDTLYTTILLLTLGTLTLAILSLKTLFLLANQIFFAFRISHVIFSV